MSISFIAPVIASKPVAKTSASSVYLGIGGAQPGRRDFLDWLASDIDQGDVVAIVGLVIVGIEDEPLGADRMVVGAQQFGRLGVLDGGANLPADKLKTQCRLTPC